MITRKSFENISIRDPDFSPIPYNNINIFIDDNYRRITAEIQKISHRIFNEFNELVDLQVDLKTQLIPRFKLENASSSTQVLLNLIQQLILSRLSVLQYESMIPEKILEEFYIIPSDHYQELIEYSKEYSLRSPNFMMQFFQLKQQSVPSLGQRTSMQSGNHQKVILAILLRSQLVFKEFYQLIETNEYHNDLVPFTEELTSNEKVLCHLVHQIILTQLKLLKMHSVIPKKILDSFYLITQNQLTSIKSYSANIALSCPQFFQLQQNPPLPALSIENENQHLIVIDETYKKTILEVQHTAFLCFQNLSDLLKETPENLLANYLIPFSDITLYYPTEKTLFDVIQDLIISQMHILKASTISKKILDLYYLIPLTQMEELLKLSKNLYQSCPSFFVQHSHQTIVIDDQSRYKFLKMTPEKFVKAFFNSQERKKLRIIAKEKIEAYIKMAIPKKGSVEPKELPKARENVFKMFACDDTEIKKEALNALVLLLEKDPLDTIGSDKLIELLTNFLYYLNPDEYKKLHTSLKPLFVKAFAEVLELLLLYNAVQEMIVSVETRESALNAADILNDKDIPESFFWTEYAKELAKYLATDVSEIKDWIKRIALVVRASLHLAAGIQNTSYLPEALEQSYEDLKKAVNHIEPKKPWLRPVLFLKRLAHISAYDFSKFQHMISSIQQMKHASSIKVIYASVISLEHVTLNSSCRLIQEEAMKLLVQYLSIQDKIVAHRIVKMFKKCLTFEINNPLSYTSYLLMKLIHAADLIFDKVNKEALKTILTAYEKSPHFKNEKDLPFFENAIKYFLKGFSDKSFQTDIGGKTFLTVLCPSSHQKLLPLMQQLDRLCALRASESDAYGSNAYHDAAATDGKMIAAISQSGIKLDINCKDHINKDTPLHLGIKRKCSTTALTILEHGGDPNLRNNDGDTPLHLAVRNGCVGLIPSLMGYNSDPNIVNHLGFTPLNEAIATNDPIIVDSIFSKAFEKNQLNDFYPLLQAIKEKKYSVLKVLLTHYKKIPSYAAIELLYMMVDSDNQLTCDEKFARFHATQLVDNQNYTKCFDSYREFPQPYIENNRIVIKGDKGTPPPLILFAKQLDEEKVLNYNFESDAVKEIVNIPDRTNNTALSYLALHPPFHSIISKLVRHKAIVDHFNHLGLTPLHLAVLKGNRKGAEQLILCGADVNAKTTQRHFTPLHMAAFIFDISMIDLLIFHNADPNARTSYGDTPLILVCLYANDSPRVPNLTMISRSSPVPFNRCKAKAEKILKKLLSLPSINPHLTDSFGNNLLHMAVDPALIQTICQSSPALFWQPNHENQIPIETALLRNQHTQVKQLLDSMTLTYNLEKKTAQIKLSKDLQEKILDRLSICHILAAANFPEMFKEIVRDNPAFATHQDSSFTESTPLHVAAKRGHLGILKVYQELAIDLNFKDKRKNTSGHISILAGCTKFTEGYIDAEGDLNAKNVDGRTMMHLAAIKGNLDVLKKLYQKGANPIERDAHGDTPLHLASLKGRIETVTYLLKITKEAVNMINEDGRSPVHYACSQSNYSEIGGSVMDLSSSFSDNKIVLEQLYQAKGNLEIQDESGATPLIIASAYGLVNIVQLLLSKGVNLRARDANLHTALHHATRGEHVEVVNALLHHDRAIARPANRAIFLMLDIDHELPIHLLAKKAKVSDSSKMTAITELFLQYGSPLTRSDENKFTVLHWACKHGRSELVEFYLTRMSKLERIKLFSGDRNGNTPLFYACMGGFTGIVMMLIDHGMNRNTSNSDGLTPLMICAQSGNFEIARHLVLRGANTGSRDKQGKTVVHHLLEKKELTKNDLAFLEFLLRNNRSLSIASDHKDAGKNRPIHILAKYGHTEALDILIAHIPGNDEEKIEQLWKRNKDKKAPSLGDIEDTGTAGAIARGREHFTFEHKWRNLLRNDLLPPQGRLQRAFSTVRNSFPQLRIGHLTTEEGSS